MTEMAASKSTPQLGMIDRKSRKNPTAIVRNAVKIEQNRANGVNENLTSWSTLVTMLDIFYLSSEVLFEMESWES